MIKILKIFIPVLLIVLFSCEPRDKKTGRADLITARDLVPVLTDLYLADGLLSYPPVKILYSAKDSVSNYTEIIEKHGFTKERMDRTLRYYFVNNPKKLQKIYDQVLAELSEIQSRIEIEPVPPVSTNLWNGKARISAPEDGIHNSASFSIPVSDTGLYVLSFNAILFKDDQSINPRVMVFFWHRDSTEEGTRQYWNKAELIRDGTRHSYSLTGNLRDTSFTHINGWLIDCDPQPDPWIKHVAVTEITLYKGKNAAE